MTTFFKHDLAGTSEKLFRCRTPKLNSARLTPYPFQLTVKDIKPGANPAVLRALRAAEMAAWEDPTVTANQPAEETTPATPALPLRAEVDRSTKGESRLHYLIVAGAAVSVLYSLWSISGLTQNWNHFVDFVRQTLF